MSAPVDSVVWHDVECGGYAIDLPLWKELAVRAGGPILDLGCGTGRVALHLAKLGHEVQALDSDPELVAAFNQRAAGLPALAVTGDARDFALDRQFALAMAPMQLLQLFTGAPERMACMQCMKRHLHPGGLAALAIVDPAQMPEPGFPPIPDAREVDQWVYSSLPLDAVAEHDSILVRRLRQTVSPGGELRDEVCDVRLQSISADALEREAEACGLRPTGRKEIAATDDHVGSTVALLEAEA